MEETVQTKPMVSVALLCCHYEELTDIGEILYQAVYRSESKYKALMERAGFELEWAKTLEKTQASGLDLSFVRKTMIWKKG